MEEKTFHSLKGIHCQEYVTSLIPFIYRPLFHFKEVQFKVLPIIFKICMEDNLFFREFVTNLGSWKDSGGKMGNGALNRSGERLRRQSQCMYCCCPRWQDSLGPQQDISSLQELLCNIKYMLQLLLQFQLIKVLNHTMLVFSCYDKKVFISTSAVAACPEELSPSLLDAAHLVNIAMYVPIPCRYSELQTSHFSLFPRGVPCV